MKPTRRWLCAVMCFGLTATLSQTRLSGQEAPTKAGSSEKPPGLVSKAKLNPALIDRLREMRFSPNGASLLLQDDSSAYVIGTNPVSMQLNLAARQILPMRFSDDSQEVVAATRNLVVAHFKLATRSRVDEKTLGGGGQCYAAALSSDGELYACLDGNSELRVFRVRTGEQIFKKTIGEQEGPAFPVPAPYHLGLARSEPFGYYLTTDYFPPEATTAAMLNFSPDGHYLIARSKFFQQPAQLVDLQSKKTIGMPKSLRDASDNGTVTFVSADRVIATTLGKNGGSELVSFPGGDVQGKVDHSGFLRATENPRYVIDVALDMSGAKLVDLQTDQTVARLSANGSDVNENVIASYGEDGVLTLTRIGEKQPLMRVRIPVSPLQVLKTAAVSPNLKAIAVGIDGNAGIYSVASGKNITSFVGLKGAWFPNDETGLVLAPGSRLGTDAVESVDPKSGALTNVTTITEVPYLNETISSGSVLLTHWIKPLPPGQMPPMGMRSFPYEIHALDPSTGKQLWGRAFEIDQYSQTPQIKSTPVVYTDPQGDRVVLGWGAKTDGGKHAAEQSAAAGRMMKQVKVAEHDSVFEVLDGRSGKTVGAAFVPTSAGPDRFDSVFSEGDWLVLEKDGQRVDAISLSKGAEVAQETGNLPAISAQSGLLSVAGNSGQLTITNLQQPAEKQQYTFPGNVAYSHFSADGKRLLVMTDDQTVYILDVSAQAATSN